MTYTSHGQHIAGTTRDDEFGQISRARCGGQLLCSVCMKDAESVIKALDKGIDVSGLLDSPEASKDGFHPYDRAKLFVVGARNNVVSDEKDQITINDLALIHFFSTPDGWTAQIMTNNFKTDGLLFWVSHTLRTDVTIVETFTKIEHDIFSQEG